MNTENKIIEAKVIEVKNIEVAQKMDESVTGQYCFVDGKKTIGVRLFKVNEEVGTVNLCQACELNMEVEKVRAKYGGNTKEMLKQNAIAAGNSAKKGFMKLFAFGKELMK